MGNTLVITVIRKSCTVYGKVTEYRVQSTEYSTCIVVFVKDVMHPTEGIMLRKGGVTSEGSAQGVTVVIL